FSLGTQMVIVQYLPLLLQQPSPGMDTAQSSTIFALYGFASVLCMLLLGSVLVKLPMYRTLAVAITLAALSAILVSITSDAGFGTLLITLTAAGFFIPAAVGPTRNVLTVEAYPADLKGTGLGAMEMYARLGSAGLGAAGGVIAGAGIGLGGFFLVLLVPLGILGCSLGIRKRSQQRKTQQPPTEEKTTVNSLAEHILPLKQLRTSSRNVSQQPVKPFRELCSSERLNRCTLGPMRMLHTTVQSVHYQPHFPLRPQTF